MSGARRDRASGTQSELRPVGEGAGVATPLGIGFPRARPEAVMVAGGNDCHCPRAANKILRIHGRRSAKYGSNDVRTCTVQTNIDFR